MKIISPRIHAYLDYIVAALLIFTPWIFAFPMKGPEVWTPLLVGLTILTYSILTRFKNEHFGIISLKTHLIFDVLLGIVLALSPLFFEFTHISPIPQIAIGVIICVIALLTSMPPNKDVTK
tara:strand:+ start:25852 stop:26214 length:363 start_codon:yes stop_codon:yes gene_type:complete